MTYQIKLHNKNFNVYSYNLSLKNLSMAARIKSQQKKNIDTD